MSKGKTTLDTGKTLFKYRKNDPKRRKHAFLSTGKTILDTGKTPFKHRKNDLKRRKNAFLSTGKTTLNTGKKPFEHRKKCMSKYAGIICRSLRNFFALVMAPDLFCFR